MASADTVTINIIGNGGHGAVPHKAVDPVVVCSSIVIALQSIVSRNVNPQDVAIITVGSIHAGSASNVIPSTAQMSLFIDTSTTEIRQLLEVRIKIGRASC